ncbi:hypothetical protein PVAND_002753 [Polypedilum vanderplanki]|uniref:U3 small nucleolar RNA-associated protein 14 homolog A n=1 Tax=Polypedilum vanderplanki TaxID=319348 RepID=A0A9J6BSF3_POLVA|nr:hypothetical protein PVAND_002753 [Polypedilum vanderplanki]
MSSDEETEVISSSHKKLLSEINDIVKFQHIKKPKRSEPAIKNDEFHLVKTKNLLDNEKAEEGAKKRDKKSVSIQSVANIVRKTPTQKKISNQFQDTFKQSKVLNKPLEKVYAERIQRSVGYENVKTSLSRWDAIVTKNKNADQLRFPIIQEKAPVEHKKALDFSQFRYKTQMMKEMEEIHNQCFPKLSENESNEPSSELLTLEEMKERRKELARLKLRESHQIAKKRLQGKIKSKKYHRLKKKEEMKKKLKEFEELKISNPEAALKELEKIEKERVKERASLRHKNTGTWAKSMKIRAQYDTTAKKELEAQLALGRELTQKDKQSDSTDSDEDEVSTTINDTKDTENPWLSNNDNKEIDPLDDIFSGYRKFWKQKNENEEALQRLKKASASNRQDDDQEQEEMSLHSNQEEASIGQGSDSESDDSSESDGDETNASNFINDLFDAAEEKIEEKLESKIKNLKPHLMEADAVKTKNHKETVKGKKRKRNFDVNDPRYLEFSRETKLGDIDEALMEGKETDEREVLPPSKKVLNEIKTIKSQKKAFMRGTTDEIDPNAFLVVKSKHLITALPKNQEFDEIDEEEELENLQSANKMSLAEAFENDDIIDDFVAELEEEEKAQQKDDNSVLPGWGSWGGEGVKNVEKSKKTVPIVKKKDRVIINTKVNDKLKKHLISALPFPFTTIKDFQASMRYPIGKDFVPAAAHSKLTESSFVTKAGTIIEPMTEEVLVQSNTKHKRKKGKFIKRKK